ncbi:hypothetical protein CWB89_15380 [Pseudoalteromonas piscicida]|uniref:Uncharacterized protein n=1 Tax=Pseudoalteromonas piscicida TaxID=43662 RepID=A0AAQ2ES59_PSEO7|nr:MULTISPECIES: hypothetical protein [Pseudoalteromonas]KJY92897.1 hypothetical protein TW75_01005 [Pseudoalteromonas piscicida]TMN39611.1 hypothetical protein CWB95_12345 [Pseudoalteromonas piscicida]TMN41018.1 hypothetical protein CWB94_08325 [Pseudoalteromonas piscicida]TMN49435.1 hypothetical protein CWB92_15370 [Pseudoalteromonas piscicida]TMN51528.1 hypothetical protein CWB91_12655 [Pseudoalteromonas piscicida]
MNKKSVTVVYGITSSTNKFIESDYNEDDNLFVTTHGQEPFRGTHSISLCELAERNDIVIRRIIICSEAVTAILSSLRDFNIPLENCFFYNHSKNQLTSYKELIIPAVEEEKILYAVYDLSSHLPCFDITTFSILAEHERRKLKLNNICFIILPNISTQKDYEGVRQFHTEEDYNWRVDHIVKSVMRCIPSCISIVELPFREKLPSFINESKYIYPAEAIHGSVKTKTPTTSLKSALASCGNLAFMKPPKNAITLVKNYIDNYIKGKKLITVTLREYQEQVVRNNDIQSWSRFLNEIDTEVYYPIIVRDSYYSASPMPKGLEAFNDFPQASADFLVRLALYQEAYLNMGVSTGPTFTISFIKNARSLIFHPIDEDNPASSSEAARKAGLTIGEDYFFNDNEFQKTIWQRDSYENIRHNFYKLIEKISNREHEEQQ